MEKFDVVIIGSGPGGYVAAIRCAQLGKKVAIVEKYTQLGGTCLHVGCIPSKALLDSSEHYYQALHHFPEHGITIDNIKPDIIQMIKRKTSVVETTAKGVAFLMKKNKITVYNGVGTFKDAHILKVTKQDKNVLELEFEHAIIATGSKPITPAPFNYDKIKVITSTEALQLTEIPKRMVIIGAGVIGLELGSVYARLGTKIEVIEFMDRILPGMDLDCAKELQKTLQKLGMTFHLGHSVKNVEHANNTVTINFQNKQSEEEKSIGADYCLIAIGRRAYTDNLGLDSIGIKLDEKQKIPVNAHLQTIHPHIYAIGDVIQGAMLAHKAEEEGVYVAELLANQKPHIDYNLIPGVVYTWPECASVGKTEEQLSQEQVEYKVGKFPYKALGRARASMDVDGLAKVIAHKKTDEVLGVHICGARAADMIMEAVALMEFKASAEDMARICHPHPTFTEALKEAALDATEKRAIHM